MPDHHRRTPRPSSRSRTICLTTSRTGAVTSGTPRTRANRRSSWVFCGIRGQRVRKLGTRPVRPKPIRRRQASAGINQGVSHSGAVIERGQEDLHHGSLPLCRHPGRRQPRSQRSEGRPRWLRQSHSQLARQGVRALANKARRAWRHRSRIAAVDRPAEDVSGAQPTSLHGAGSRRAASVPAGPRGPRVQSRHPSILSCRGEARARMAWAARHRRSCRAITSENRDALLGRDAVPARLVDRATRQPPPADSDGGGKAAPGGCGRPGSRAGLKLWI
jgi:hypothetical protein